MSFQPKGTISKITKSRSRKTPSPFAASKRNKSTSGSQRTTTGRHKEISAVDELPAELGLEKISVLRTKLAPGLVSDSVEAILKYAPTHMFSDVPQRAAGMNSTKISTVLNFRLTLPRIVSTAYVHALRGSPTSTEREIASLIARGIVRKITIPGRGLGASALGDGLVLVEDWIALVQSYDNLDPNLKEKYIKHLRDETEHPLLPNEIKTLAQNGFVTAKSMMPTNSETFLRVGPSSLGSLNYVGTAGTRHAAGSDGAVAKSSVQYAVGGTRAANRLQPSSSSLLFPHTVSLPNVGPYLKLISESRDHLLTFLLKLPYKSMPLSRLKEYWDGGVVANDSLSVPERRGVLPGRTKKWRDFNGLKFEYVLAECIGSGLVECFRTGSIGTGVRAL
ncbi:hypothetical protein BT63DRAFT_43469 [Microthyrium microscopicum]|uniref:Serine-threonine protein kinase 19 n=1 Tax=Microthyrium microscopicum TaxID=703497 RepID=A0A6A6U2R5_9PEZI|nr:hypothetical protein BT63DRAFT_43469 [Microthyrium microscopicum]